VGSVAAVGRLVDARSRQRPAGFQPAADTASSTPGRALVPLAPAERGGTWVSARQRPSAAFLAQLIAANRHLPQARERRRAEPHEAIAAYAAVSRAA
jgi:hypothetical protein